MATSINAKPVAKAAAPTTTKKLASLGLQRAQKRAKARSARYNTPAKEATLRAAGLHK